MWSRGSVATIRMGKNSGEPVNDRRAETVSEAAFADGLVIRIRSRIMSIALMVADWLRKLRVRESRMVAAVKVTWRGWRLGLWKKTPASNRQVRLCLAVVAKDWVVMALSAWLTP